MSEDIKKALEILERCGLSERAIERIKGVIKDDGKRFRLAMDVIYAERVH